MSDYVEHLWQSRNGQDHSKEKLGRVLSWMLGVIAAISIAAFLTHDYWYPYVSPYF